MALAAGVTSVFAQNVKEGNITFSLTAQKQVSVSETTAANAGYWVDPVTTNGPTHYKTGTTKFTQADIINAISAVTGTDYGKTPKLSLVQGELSGFFTMTGDLWDTYPYAYTNDGEEYVTYTGSAYAYDGDSSTVIGEGTDSLYTILASGRHFDENPLTGQYPVGHLQPWGQIFVKYTKSGTNACENVTEFFGITVQECYDCFYLNSFISDATFTFKSTPGKQNGPPCCSTPGSSALFGSGVDRYYVTLSFDDTENNPYLNPDNIYYSGLAGIVPSVSEVDGILPDQIEYVNKIQSGIGSPSPYELRFTLDGILSYTWNLKVVDSTIDTVPDFVGNASLPVTGFGFIQLYCALLTGTVGIAETVNKASACCYEEDLANNYDGFWADNWFSTGEYNDFNTQGIDDDYYLYALNQNLYFQFVGYTPSTPFNTGANLSYHANFNETYTPFETQNQYAQPGVETPEETN